MLRPAEKLIHRTIPQNLKKLAVARLIIFQLTLRTNTRKQILTRKLKIHLFSNFPLFFPKTLCNAQCSIKFMKFFCLLQKLSRLICFCIISVLLFDFFPTSFPQKWIKKLVTTVLFLFGKRIKHQTK